MFVKETKVKSAGRTLTYLQLVESYRDGKRVRQRVLANLGRQDQLDPAGIDKLIASLAPHASVPLISAGDLQVLPGKELGSLLVLDTLWRDLDLDRVLTELTRDRRFSFPFAAVVKAVVFGRVLHPGSERALVREWLERVDLPEIDGIELHHAYRALATLAEIHEDLERRLAERLMQASEVDASLLLFDTTSTYFEGVGPTSARFGYSRDHRADRPQVTLALLTSREGTPLAHWLFPGNQSDLVSMASASVGLRERLGLDAQPFVLVVDRGMVSRANLERLREAGVPYVAGERLRAHRARDGLARAGRYRRVTPTLEVKEVRQEAGAERLLVCRNLERADADRLERERIVESLEAKLAEGRWRSLLPASARRYVRLEASTPVIDRERVKADARFDGKWVLTTTSDLPAAEVALAYRGLWRVERAFRTLKTPLEIRPVYHHSEAGVRGHVLTCVLAFLLVRLLEDRLSAAGLAVSAREVLARLASIQRLPVRVGKRTVSRVTRPDKEQRGLLKAVGVRLPEA